MNPLILVDISHLVFRHHYTKRNFSYEGRATGGLFGAIQTLIKLKRDNPEAHIIAAFDSRSKHRHEVVRVAREHGVLPEAHEYKGGRDKGEEYQKIVDQIDRLLEFLQKTVVQAVKMPGNEADDIIGTYSTRGQSLIVSGDKDFYQLISPTCQVFNPGKDLMITEDHIRHEYNLEPVQMIDVGAFAGDKSDNIPGVPGIGEKTALKLIQTHGDVRGVIEAAAKAVISGTLRNKILDNKNLILLSRELKEINTQLDVPEIASPQPQPEAIQEFIIEGCGFRSLVNQIEIIGG